MGVIESLKFRIYVWWVAYVLPAFRLHPSWEYIRQMDEISRRARRGK
ncbi:MAG: hypothetical protein IPO08_23400 [Xanthomonadales bacterium]|nr:hypothetical protein [Xanthomonadales bacterium]